MRSGAKDRKAQIEKFGVAFDVASGYDIVHDYTELRIMVHLPDEQLFTSAYKRGAESLALTKREVALMLRAIAKKIIRDEKKRGLK